VPPKERKKKKKENGTLYQYWNCWHFFLMILSFWDRVSLCSLGWPRTQDPPASTSQMLGLQAHPTTPAINWQHVQLSYGYRNHDSIMSFSLPYDHRNSKLQNELTLKKKILYFFKNYSLFSACFLPRNIFEQCFCYSLFIAFQFWQVWKSL
jgi:hypothetical protein